LGYPSGSIRKIKQAFGVNAVGITQIKERFNRFKDGCMSADSDQRSRRPSTSRNADVINKVQTLIMEDRLLIVREVADAVGISRDSANTILTEELWNACNWQLHYDNAPAHSSHLMQGFLAKHGIPQVRQVPYSPDMAPCNFWLCPRLKTPLKDCRFDSREDILQNATAQLHTIPKQAFQNCFQLLKDRWAKCVESQGAYFEGN
jgi:hypothetical protein